jgi:hypothetical protein
LSLSDRKTPLRGVAIKWALEQAHIGKVGEDGKSPIRTAAVDDNNVLGPPQARKRAADIPFLVLRQYDGRDVIEHAD